MRVLVLGGGVIGTSTAYFLARHGHEVTVVDRQDDVGQETSFANGGIIHPSLVDPWNGPGIAGKLIKLLGQEDSPLLLRPRALLGDAGWFMQFVRNSAPARHRRNTETNLRLALYSANVLKQVRNDTGIDYAHGTRGSIKVFRDQETLDESLAMAQFLEPLGVRFEQMDRRRAVEFDPALAPIAEHILGAIHFPDDESGDACKFTQELAGTARDLGVAFRLETTVQALLAEGDRIVGVATERERLEADAYVLAFGSHSPAIVRPLGIRLPVHPVKGYSLTAPLGGWNAAPQQPVIDETLKIGITVLGDRVRMAGSAEFAGYDTTLNARRTDYIWRAATQVFPELTRHVDRSALRPWTGLRPMTPDGPPILGPTPLRNLFLNTGHGHLGWTMACGSGKAVAELVSGGRPEINLAGLTVDRFR